VTVVRRFNQDSGRPTPEVPAGLLTLMDRLTGPPDFWDRPHGDFGPLTHLYGLDDEVRQRANSLYRLGSKALARYELAPAAKWLGSAAAAGHPGALFRLALVALRSGEDWAEDAWFLVAEAARHGHGDAERLLAALASRPCPTAARVEDETCYEEIRRLLGVPGSLMAPDRPRPAPAPASCPQDMPPPGEAHAAAGSAGTPGLVLVPAPVLPAPHGPGPRPTSLDPERPHLTALPGGLVLPVPEFQPSSPTTGRLTTTGEPWSASALRPALLTDMARHSAPAVVPARWQTTQRARDMLLLIHDSDGIDTRTLTRRTRMPMNLVVRLLDWLREEHFIDTIGGAHFPGTLMTLATATDPEGTLLKGTLADLRDELAAAVYISTYTDGEIIIRQSASSTTAPPVRERAPFSGTGHASAVGKSLLAQLDFPSRMDHLTRYPSFQLTERTITSKRELFQNLDCLGPHSAQFDLLEYSDDELCVAYSLGLPGRASSVALSLPVTEHERLVRTARLLSQRATGLLLAHLLSDDLQQTGRSDAEPPQAHAPVPRRALP
jgi:DNA-binding IclR family transcriptional regulator